MATNNLTAQQSYIKLIELRDTSGANIYERLKLADRLLSDREWVHLPEGGGGDESKAIDRLEDNAFGDLCGALSLPEMLDILKGVPQLSQWKAMKFNIRKLHGELKDRQRKKGNPATPVSPLREPRTIEEKYKAVQTEKQLLLREIADLKRENRRLRTAVSNLQQAVNNLQLT